MDELTSKISERLGLEKVVVQKAIGALLRFLQEQSRGTNFFDFDQILSTLQGAKDLMEDKEAEQVAQEVVEQEKEKSNKSSSVTGVLFGMIFHLVFVLLQAFGVIAMLKQFLLLTFGENAVKMIESVQDGAELAIILKKFGIDHEKGMKMVRMLVDYMKDKVDPELMDKLMEHVPAIKTFLADDKKED